MIWVRKDDLCCWTGKFSFNWGGVTLFSKHVNSTGSVLLARRTSYFSRISVYLDTRLLSINFEMAEFMFFGTSKNRNGQSDLTRGFMLIQYFLRWGPMGSDCPVRSNCPFRYFDAFHVLRSWARRAIESSVNLFKKSSIVTTNHNHTTFNHFKQWNYNTCLLWRCHTR